MRCLKCCGVFLSDVYIIEEAINQFADFEASFVSFIPFIGFLYFDHFSSVIFFPFFFRLAHLASTKIYTKIT